MQSFHNVVMRTLQVEMTATSSMLIVDATAGPTTRPPSTTCAYYEFTCRDGSCVDDRLKCDGRRDCPDGSDELECGIHS